MDVPSPKYDWPEQPYRGLDFYHEADAILFRERDNEIRECANLLLGFGVKLLLIHGPSGSGKSSFVRAGLIPFLQKDIRRSCLFLNVRDSVIRCTMDPLPEIARSLISALNRDRIFSNTDQTEVFLEEHERAGLSSQLEKALSEPREQLRCSLLDALVGLCTNLPSRLILLLDQAEEVLTRTERDQALDNSNFEFFRFLEDVYIRNLDLRLILTLRTEYYGRFRDELRISDDRLAHRPMSGGVQPFLLHPLRDKNALMRIINAPAEACKIDGEPVYKFNFQAELVRQIVDDLVSEFRVGSITPALQVVCATLFERKKNGSSITLHDYKSAGSVRGIVRSYVETGIRAINARGSEIDYWHLFLHSLVSRQGGGTVVSLAEPYEILSARAIGFGIRGPIKPKLIALTEGKAPLLRGDPADNPTLFSLKHDVLAVVLSRWFDERGGALRARGEERRKWRLILGAVAAAIIALGVGVGIFLYRGSRDFSVVESDANVRTTYALNAPTSDFRLSLLLLLHNLQATEQPRNLYEQVTHSNAAIHTASEEALKKLFSRVPWFAGKHKALAVSPDGNMLAVLSEGVNEASLELVTLPSGNDVQPTPKREIRKLPPTGGQPLPISALGFVDKLGP